MFLTRLLILINLVSTFNLFSQYESKQEGWYLFNQSNSRVEIDLNKSAQLALEIVEMNLVENEPVKGKIQQVSGRLINYQDDEAKIITQDGSLIMILETKIGGEWEPVEYWNWSDCGNSYMNLLQLRSGEFVEFKIRGHSGTVSVDLRLKMFTGSKLIYSPEFRGKIKQSLLTEIQMKEKKGNYKEEEVYLKNWKTLKRNFEWLVNDVNSEK